MDREQALVVLQDKAALTLGVPGLAESDTLADKGADSLAVIELALDLEETFGVVLTESDIGPGTTLGDLVDLLLIDVVP